MGPRGLSEHARLELGPLPAGRRPVRSVPLAPAGGAPRIQGGVCHEAGLHVVQGRGTKAGFSKLASPLGALPQVESPLS